MHRKPGYLIGLFLAALVLSAPQLATCIQLGVITYQSRSFPWRMVWPGLMSYGNTLSFSPMWKGKFIYGRFSSARKDGKIAWHMTATDPETGQSTDLGFELIGSNGFMPMVFEDRLFFVGNSTTYEVIDGVARQLTYRAATTIPWNSHFLLNGEPVWISNAVTSWSLLPMDKMTPVGTVTFPADQTLTLDGTVVDFRGQSSLQCINQGNRLHVFLLSSQRLLYREGLELDQVNQSADQPASALSPANVNPSLNGWSLVRSKQIDPLLNSSGRRYLPPQPMLIGGMPAALIADGDANGNMVGHLYRFDGKRWSEFVAQPFPFGASQVQAVTSDDQKSYIVVTTTTGIAHVYAVDKTGIRVTRGASGSNPGVNPVLMAVQPMVAMPIIGFVTGTILGLVVLMFFVRKADVGFGNRAARLSSLARRGLARLIDMILIGSVLAGLGWALTYGLDFQTMAEAINLKVDHPTIDAAITTVLILLLTLAVIVVGLVFIQGRYGVTPGKWCCGVRVLRSTLRPCGFARSLVREVVLSVDSCNLTCWTPGILSFALTDHRQRLGDLVADTVVIDIKTMKPARSLNCSPS